MTVSIAALPAFPLAWLMDSEKLGTEAVIMTLTAKDIELANAELPLHCAVMECVPMKSADVEKEACLLVLSARCP